MKSAHELEISVQWAHETLLQQAEAERLAAQARHGSPDIRRRLAAALYALADWLNANASNTERGTQNAGLEAA